MAKAKRIKFLYNPSNNPRQILTHTAPERYVLFGGTYGGGLTGWLANTAAYKMVPPCVNHATGEVTPDG